jgi:DNA-binding NarL/FixJ family response regulator
VKNSYKREKLHVTNRTQAALYALRQGWATLDE